MDPSKNDENIKVLSNIDRLPPGIDVAEDSGFASIAEATTNSTDDAVQSTNKLICDDTIKFCDAPIENPDILAKRKADRERAEAKRQAEAEYDHEKKEKTYKRLMHLLSKSKFYSKHIIDKINDPNKENKNKGNLKRKYNDSNKSNDTAQSAKKTKKMAAKKVPAKKKKYDDTGYISDDIQKKVKKNMNLSQEAIEDELNTESDNEDEQSTPTAFVKPKYFVGDLYKYQQEGVQWLNVLYENGLNGILADEMGLGKTIQVIALICSLIEKKQPGPYLIIVPLSTLPNWIMEFEKFAPTIPFVVLYGTREERIPLVRKISSKYPAGDDGFKTQPVVLTTFETPFREPKLRAYNWRYIIIDEGHRIKNHKCQLVTVLKTYKSMNRLLLTGTPMQNNLAELWSLLHFLLPDIFNQLDVFESWFNIKELQGTEGTERFLQQEKENRIISSLREILKPFMLRRVKVDVNLNIPPKKEIIVYAPLTELQRDLYSATLNRDYSLMTKVQEQLVIDDESGARPKRKCLTRNKYSTTYQNVYDTSLYSSNTLNNTDDPIDYKNSKFKNDPRCKKVLPETWKQYGNVTDRNYEYFIHITFGNRTPMYKHIVNHPYLVHCPLDDTGAPSINEDLVKVSGKLLVLDAMLNKLYKQGHKVLLFSTMTSILDVIADYLMLRPWNFVRLDGRTDVSDRKIRIAEFNSDPNIFLFLISTRAGGIGLNLAAADTVIIYDSDWNLQADIQAMARCHRIGQTRPVVVYRLCTKGTIDEAIIQRAEAKGKLEKMVITKDIPLNVNKAETLLELKRLLDSADREIITSEREVFTEAELDKLLDRSDLMIPKKPANDAKSKVLK